MSYLLAEGSMTGHCCFEFTVIKHDGDIVCEFLDEEDANDVLCKLNNHDKLVDALKAVTSDYVQLAESGDAGCWTADDVVAIVNARKLLKELGYEI